MKKLEYSPDALEKLLFIKEEVSVKYGSKKAKFVIKKIKNVLRGLQQFEEKGSSVENTLGIPCDYRILYVAHNYVFYSVCGDCVRIVDIFNEKEDFMWKLFGIRTTTQETEEYWDE